MIPSLFEFTEEEIEFVFEQELPTLFLFRDSETDKDAEFMKVYAEASQTHRGKILFAYSDIASDIQERLGDFMGVTKEEMPVLVASVVGQMKKFKCKTKPSDLTVDSIGKWADDVLSGAVKAFYKS